MLNPELFQAVERHAGPDTTDWPPEFVRIPPQHEGGRGGTATLITWRTRQGRGSPLESLQQLEHAVRAKDRPGIEQFLDVRRTAESVVDEANAAAGALGG